MTKELPENFCSAPWTSYHIKQNGKIGPCFYVESIHDNYTDYINSDELKQLKQDFSDGKRPDNPGCNYCFKEDDGGLLSLRARTSKLVLDKYSTSILENSEPSIVTFELGNKCNAKCRTCGSHASTLYIKEELQLGKQPSKINKTSFDPLLKLNNLKEIEFLGGEPMLHQKDIVDFLRKTNNNNFTLSLITNGSKVLSDDLLKIIKEKKLTIVLCYSIDGTEDVYGYTRHPLKWEQLIHNIQYTREQIQQYNIEYSIVSNSCASILSIWHFAELYDWIFKNIGITNYYYKNVDVPYFNSLQILPTEIKDRIRDHLQTKKLYPFLKPFVQYMYNGEHNEIEWNKFIMDTLNKDAYRGEKIEDSLGEYGALLKSYF